MNTDYVQRFLFENLDIRGRLVCLTGAWRRMTDGRGYPAPVAELLGQSTALTALLGVNRKVAGRYSGRVTLQVQAPGPASAICSAAASSPSRWRTARAARSTRASCRWRARRSRRSSRTTSRSRSS